MITPRQWYDKTEDFLAPTWPLMLVLAAILIGVTAYLVVTKNRTALAGWLTYMYMP
jgi:hypothetical protein